MLTIYGQPAVWTNVILRPTKPGQFLGRRPPPVVPFLYPITPVPRTSFNRINDAAWEPGVTNDPLIFPSLRTKRTTLVPNRGDNWLYAPGFYGGAPLYSAASFMYPDYYQAVGVPPWPEQGRGPDDR